MPDRLRSPRRLRSLCRRRLTAAGRYRPVSPDRLVAELAQCLRGVQPPGPPRPILVALDGPRCAELSTLADQLAEHLRVVGTPTEIVRTEHFYRDASVRLEYGHTDVDSYYEGWLDEAALTREVLQPVLDGAGGFLIALRDPVTNRSIRGDRVTLDSGVVLVTGELLLRDALPFDFRIHAALTRPARRRRTTDQWLWTLPALDRYDMDAKPAGRADAVIRYDDPAHPALLVR